MEKIKNYFIKYFKTKSWFGITTDILFYALILSLLIPATRTKVTSLIIRTTMIRPTVIDSARTEKVSAAEMNFLLEDIDGNQVNLSDFTGQTILVNFWTTWCPPCRAEMPSIQKLHDTYGNRLPMFLITNESRTKVLDYLKENDYKLPVYFQKSAGTGIFNVGTFPTSILISGKGQILVNKKGAANWNSGSFRDKLDEVLGRGTE
ncbi:MAG: TlpA family protein disulfide reductase [Bacteroidales bacterium]|nr:TlpA family protein disulfide reductase [Bacteroidales bacterium]MCB9013779.1 TlpA family protein disulfide reductase [Bacteroidales bacterium]